MIRRYRLLAVVVSLFVSGSMFMMPGVSVAGGTSTSVADPGPVRVLSYNVKSENTRKNFQNDNGVTGRLWADARNAVFGRIQMQDPAIFGVQEASKGTQSEFAAAFPAHSAYPSDGAVRIFFKTARFSMLDSGSHVYTAPASPGAGETAACGHQVGKRALHWVLLNEIATGQRYFVMNTHLYAGACPTYRKSAVRQIHNRIDANRNGAPIVLMGDFNARSTACGGTSGVIEAIVASGDYAHNLRPSVGLNDCAPTFNSNWDSSNSNDGASRIDFIFHSRRLEAYQQVTDNWVGANLGGTNTSPSDHYPVSARLRFP